MSRKPAISSARILILAALAVLVAVVVLESGGGGSSDESRASQGYIVRSSDPVGPQTSTPSAPKPSWPLPNESTSTSRPAGKVSTEPSGMARPARPCLLVTSSEAASILEGAVSVSEGMQGPSCIYTSDGSARQVAVAVVNGSISNLRNRPDMASRVQVGGRTGWCLRHGTSSVEVPLSDERVLNVSGPCAAATRFAALALERVQS